MAFISGVCRNLILFVRCCLGAIYSNIFHISLTCAPSVNLFYNYSCLTRPKFHVCLCLLLYLIFLILFILPLHVTWTTHRIISSSLKNVTVFPPFLCFLSYLYFFSSFFHSLDLRPFVDFPRVFFFFFFFFKPL